MRVIICLVLFCIPSFGYSKNAEVVMCEIIKSFKFNLNTIALNIANNHTTKTKEGGPYIPKTIYCVNDKCKLIDKKVEPILTYEPSHPDAKKNGYVAYPNIDIDIERLHFQIIAEKIFAIAKEGKCGLIISMATDSLTVVTYSNPKTVDSFIKNQKGEIIIWSSNSKRNILAVNLLTGKNSNDFFSEDK